jgi:hypothetical protein
MSGDFGEGRAAIRRSVQLFDEIGAWWHALGSRAYAAQLEVLAGDLGAAEAVVGEIYRLREEHGLEEPVWWADLELANVVHGEW